MIRPLLGVFAKDLPRFLRTMAGGPQEYLAIRNRTEDLTKAPSGASGYRCDWRWTSELHAPKVIPALGCWLLGRALSDRPIVLADVPAMATPSPDVTFVIGHRGRERSPLLDMTLKSIAGQRGAAIEAIVVEQTDETELSLQAWVRHLTTRTPATAPYNRAWAFNVGARAARGKVIVLHDGDMLVPAEYARCILERVEAGNDVVELKRFIFYLSERDTQEVCRTRRLSGITPERIVQNLLGGGSLAITAVAYAELGGMDEGFVGWGGEDSEFWERCALVRRWDYTSLPIVHLWHRDQPKKERADNPMIHRYQKLAAVPATDRAARLAALPRGEATPRAEDAFADVLGGA